MTTITDTSILNWLPSDDYGGELWRLAFINSENQNWNATDPSNSTTTLTMTAAYKQGTGSSMFASPAHLGLVTGLLLSLLINSQIWTAKPKREGFATKLLSGDPKSYQWILHLTPSSSFTFASSKTFILPYLYLLPLLAIVLLMPLLFLLAVFLLPFAMYRYVVQIYLQYQTNNQVRKKLFSGADAVWTFNESQESYSVINALVILEGKPDINKLREVVTTRLVSIPKLRMRHDFTLGYATWYEDLALDLGSLVQWIPGNWGDVHTNDCNEGMDSVSKSKSEVKKEKIHESMSIHTKEFCGGRNRGKRSKINNVDKEWHSPTKWNRKNMSKIVEQFCNRPLPENHTVSWEALVGKGMPWDEGEANGNDVHNIVNQCMSKEAPSQTVFPILFRIHHSVGDGASLLQLLMSTLTDDEPTVTKLLTSKKVRNPTSLSRPLKLNFNTVDNDPTNTDVDHIISSHVSHDTIRRSVSGKTQVLEKLKYNTDPKDHFCQKESSSVTMDRKTASHFKNPSIKRKIDTTKKKESSFLYGRRLSGKKTILWDSTSVTVEEIKKIRAATSVKFTEILLSSVSAALSNYWEAREKGQLNDSFCANKKCPRINCNQLSRKGKNDFDSLSQEVESEDDWDQLEDVMEENECQGKEHVVQTESGKLENPPSSVKLVLPAILGSLFQNQKDLSFENKSQLENLFSVAVMTLPVGKSGGCPLERLSKVSDASGSMMPLRKDSIIECEKKWKYHKDVTTDKLVGPVKKMCTLSPIMDQESVNSSLPLGSMPSVVRNENIQTHFTSKEQPKAAAIKPDGPEILTYYYTKQPDVELKLNDATVQASNKGTQVHYCKSSDSANVILHEKEPYHCPITIFFTQNNDTSIGSQSSSPEKFPEDTRLLRTTLLTEKDDSNHIMTTSTTGESNPERRVISTSHIQFPTSPTIQHLLTRWLALDIVATVLPSVFAAPMMSVAANGVAVVMSNLPGPPKRLHSILGGHALKDIVFWAPHRGFTGLGITILSYDGMLHIGLMADDAVVPTQKGAQLIMDTVIDELHSLGAAVSSRR